VDQQTALEACERSTLNGYEDWRLPTIYELSTLIDYSQNPPFDSVFENKDLRYLWASDKNEENPSLAWIQIFNGSPKGRWIDKTSTKSDLTNYYNTYRCVRGEMRRYEYKKEGELVYDLTNGLIWQDQKISTTLAIMDGKEKEFVNAENYLYWGEARDYCESLELGGRNDWRLPNINELIATLDPKTLQIDNAFEYVYKTHYWSSTFIPASLLEFDFYSCCI